jgi:two-component system cell cycle sensor histidine kinase/response regulator CckA
MMREGIRDYGQQILKKFGYTVLVAKSGEEALDIYGRCERQIDLVIVDLSMPGMGGLKCIELLRESHPDCPIIISSGVSSKDQIQSAFEKGALEFVAKPYFVRDLLVKIRDVINFSKN